MPEPEKKDRMDPTIDAADFPDTLNVSDELGAGGPVETSPPTKTDEDTPESQDQDKDSDVPDGVQRRINKAVRKQREAERKAEKAQALLDKMQSRLAALEGRDPPERYDSKAKGPPREDQFDTFEEYSLARTQFLIDQSIKKATEDLKAEIQAARQADEEARERSRLESRFQEAAKEGRKVYKDYDEVVAQDLFNDLMRETIAELDNAHEVAYYLGSNPDIADDIFEASRRNPVSAVAQIGKIGGLLKASSRQPKKKASNAPEPVPAVGGGGDLPDAGSLDGLSIEEYVRRRRKQIQGK